MEKDVCVATLSIWVDWEHRVISFQKVPGFEERSFPTREALFTFAMKKSASGFGIR